MASVPGYVMLLLAFVARLRGSAALVLLALLPLPVQPLWAQTLEVLPAWDGHFTEGRPTEVAVWLASPAGGEVRVKATAADSSLEYSATVDADRPHLATLPVSPGRDGRLEVTAMLPDGTLLNEEVRFLPRQEGFRAQIADPATEATLAGTAEAEAPRSTADALPRLAAGYGPLESLVLHTDVLASLTADQTTALSAYLEACRPLGLLDVSPEVLEKVRAAAGCGGRYVTAQPPVAEASVPRAGRPDPLPATSRLEALGATPGRTQLGRIALLLLPYPILLLALAAGRRLGAWLLLIPAGATLVFAWVLPMSVTRATAATWAEMDAGDGSYRFVSMLDLTGSGRAQAPLRLSTDADLLSASDKGPLEQRISDSEETIGLPFPPSLLQYRRYRLEGSRPTGLSVRLEAADNGVRLVNQGAEATPAGWLVSQGKTFPVPPLEPGSDHGLALDGPTAEAPIAQLAYLARMREPALLVPFSGTQSPDHRLKETGWLMIGMPRSGP